MINNVSFTKCFIAIIYRPSPVSSPILEDTFSPYFYEGPRTLHVYKSHEKAYCGKDAYLYKIKMGCIKSKWDIYMWVKFQSWLWENS